MVKPNGADVLAVAELPATERPIDTRRILGNRLSAYCVAGLLLTALSQVLTGIAAAVPSAAFAVRVMLALAMMGGLVAQVVLRVWVWRASTAGATSSSNLPSHASARPCILETTEDQQID
jgi:hypothetical protein